MTPVDLSEVPKAFPQEPLLRLLESLLQRTAAVRGAMHACGTTVRYEASGFGFGETEAAVVRSAARSSAPVACSITAALPWTGGGREVQDSRLPTVMRRFPVDMRMEEHLALTYGGVEIGSVELVFADRMFRDRFWEQQRAVARELGLEVKRQELLWQAKDRLKLDILLAGRSRALYELEKGIEKVSATAHPVIVEGEFGSHALHTAAAIHLAGLRKHGVFAAVDCAYRDPVSLEREIASTFSRAREGTLFLNGVDLPDLQAQRQILRLLRDRSQFPFEISSPRIVVATQRPLEALVREGSFCRMLHTELDYLRVRIPALRERREDIPALMECCLERHGRFGRKQIVPEVWEACQEYDWPENESELDRVATRLAVMTENELINLEDLRRLVSWVPDTPRTRKSHLEFGRGGSQANVIWGVREEADAEMMTEDMAMSCVSDAAAIASVSILEVSGMERQAEGMLAYDAEEASIEDEFDAGCLSENAVDGSDPSQAEQEARQWRELSKRLVAGDFDGLESLGVGIARALRYVGNHYCEEISLGQLARESYISPSHLSFLFKRSLGMPFKGLLASVRIERAQQLLASEESPRITDISLDVGFGDLSHFERTFKRLVGKNPREFRRQELERRRMTETAGGLKSLPCA